MIYPKNTARTELHTTLRWAANEVTSDEVAYFLTALSQNIGFGGFDLGGQSGDLTDRFPCFDLVPCAGCRTPVRGEQVRNIGGRVDTVGTCDHCQDSRPGPEVDEEREDY